MADVNLYWNLLLRRYMPLWLVGGGGPSGVLGVNTTQAGTTAVITEEDLWTYSLPANTLNADGKGVRITVWLTTAANANNKTAKLYFGSTVVMSRDVAADNNWVYKFVADVYRTGASTQSAFAQSAVGVASATSAASQVRITTPAADTTAAIAIKAAGQNGTASASDVVFKGATVELLG